MLGNGAMFKVKGETASTGEVREARWSILSHVGAMGGLAWTIDSIVMLGSSVGD
jgi:hypothetical protein